MGTLGKFISGEYAFVVFIGTDYDRCLWINKIIGFRCCFGNEWVSVVALWKERSQEGGVIKIKQVQTRKEVQILLFCENLIIECPHL